MQDERLAFSPKEAAMKLGVSERHLRGLIARDEIRTVRLGARILIPADALRELLAEPAPAR